MLHGPVPLGVIVGRRDQVQRRLDPLRCGSLRCRWQRQAKQSRRGYTRHDQYALDKRPAA